MLSRNTKYILMILVVTGFIGIGLVIEQSSAIAGWTAYCLGCFIPEGFETAVMAYIAGFGISCIAVSTCFYLQRYLPHEESPDEA